MTTTTYTGQAYATETLVTDTRTWDITKATARTITIRARRRAPGPGTPDTATDVGAYGLRPVDYHTEPNPDAPTKVLRLRKDGTYRTAGWAHPLRFTDTPPTERRDWRD